MPDKNISEIDLEKGVVSFRVPMFMIISSVFTVIAVYAGFTMAAGLQVYRNSDTLEGHNEAIRLNQRVLQIHIQEFQDSKAEQAQMRERVERNLSDINRLLDDN